MFRNIVIPPVKTLNDFHERITARLAPIKTIIDKTAKYLIQVEDLVLGYNPSQHVQVTNAIARMRTLYSEIAAMKIDNSDPLVLMLAMTELYSRLLEIDQLLEVSYTLFANQVYACAATYNKSVTYDNEVTRERGIVYDAKDKLARISARDDDNMFEFMMPSCGDAETTIFNYIMSIPTTINKFTTSLIAYAIRQGISSGKQNKLREIIEQQKDMLLSAEHIPIGAGIVGLCERFSLVPGATMTFEEILAFMAGPHVDTDADADATSASKKSEITGGGSDQFARVAEAGHGIILFDISTPSPISFNIAGLIDHDYIMKNDLNTKPLSGLTKKVLTRLTTTSVVDTKTDSPGPMQIFPGKLPTWYIISKIGESAFRPMYNNGYIHTNPRILRGLSTRPTQYNSLMTPKILLQNELIQKTNQHVRDFTEIVEESIEPGIAKITDKLLKYFDEETFNTPADFQEFLTYEMVTAAVMRSLHPKLTEKNIAEHLVTYVLHMDTIITQIRRGIWKHMTEQTLNRLFSEHSADSLREILRGRLESIIKRVLGEINDLGLFKNYNYGLKNYVLTKSNVLI